MADDSKSQQTIQIDPNGVDTNQLNPNLEIAIDPQTNQPRVSLRRVGLDPRQIPPTPTAQQEKGPTIEAAPEPSLVDRAARTVTEGIPQFSHRTVNNPKYGQEQFLSPEELLTPQQQREHPVLTGTLEAAGGMTSPGNIAGVAATAGLGEVPEAAALIPKIVSGLFAGQMAAGVVEQYPDLKSAMDKAQNAKTPEERADAYAETQRVLTHMSIDSLMALQAGHHAVSGGVSEQLSKLGTHLNDTRKVFVEGVKESAQRALEATAPEGSLEAGFAKIGGKKVKEPTTGAQGGHAGGGVASEEELARPGRFVKVGRSGALTDQGKTPDFNLRSGEVGYQVKPDGTYEVKDGQETPTHKAAIEKYSKEVYPTPKPEYEQTLARRGQLPGQTVNMSKAYGDTGTYVGGLVKGLASAGPKIPTGLKEKSTGDETVDQHIKTAGAIPAGSTVGDQVMFHDPITGSTLSLPRDKVTSPEAVRQQITNSRAIYTQKDLTNKAVKEFGTTDDPKKAGYVMADGRGLDFSGGQTGRALDHAEVSNIPGVAARNENPRQQFMGKTGALRVRYQQPVEKMGRMGELHVEFHQDHPPTPEQVDWMNHTISNSDHRVVMDVANSDGQIVGSAMATTSEGGIERLVRDAKADVAKHATAAEEPTAEDFIKTAPEGTVKADDPKAAAVKKLVEDNGGVFRGMQVNQAGDKRIGQILEKVLDASEAKSQTQK